MTTESTPQAATSYFTRNNYSTRTRYHQATTTHLFNEASPYIAACGFREPHRGWYAERPHTDTERLIAKHRPLSCGRCLRTQAGREWQATVNQPQPAPRACRVCGGAGWVDGQRASHMLTSPTTTCRACDGTGLDRDRPLTSRS